MGTYSISESYLRSGFDRSELIASITFFLIIVSFKGTLPSLYDKNKFTSYTKSISFKSFSILNVPTLNLSKYTARTSKYVVLAESLKYKYGIPIGLARPAVVNSFGGHPILSHLIFF